MSIIQLIELSKADRIAIYKGAIESLKHDNDCSFGFCWHLSAVCRRLKGKYETAYYNGMEQNYPEIYAYKPKVTHTTTYWFPTDKRGITKRVNILKKVIAKLESL
jgi:hypothetical protein